MFMRLPLQKNTTWQIQISKSHVLNDIALPTNHCVCENSLFESNA
jgi:hypothetical protein